ncbi:hypothetical protein GCM10008018_16160 [Paenibacillus marchantiophytorum]|uniref:Glycosyltransferase family 1 protein n=1 Tax=Paenibacillus marchantiophytorum TaxID=1619310 RepID=A0ABQ2BS08_9BACL|nr:glycosyltransferase family 1 protein [Paenibacillus marchantiophytorum]GGI46246.1 hypothetical protein GCM10008018_16160 [Paenibacillus marchantiophytorum]
MKVAIDVVPIRNTGEMGGAFQLVTELIKGLAQYNDKDQYFLLTAEWNHQYFESFEQYGIERVLVQASPVKVQPPIKKGFYYKVKRKIFNKIKTLSKKIFKTVNQTKKSILRSRSIDVLFCPMSAINFSEPGIPTLSLIYDLQHKYYPQFFKEEELSVRDNFYSGICELADYVVCISEFTKDTLVDKLNYPKDRAEVVYISIQDRLDEISSEQQNETINKFGLNGKNYAYFPANFWPHKNHRILLLAMSILINKYPELDLHLCLTGSLLNQDTYFEEIINQMNLKDRVHHLGYVAEQEVSALMKRANFLIFPSLFEGFGIPVAEAMSMGVPVICSHNTSLPEVGGEAVLYFDPRKPEEIAEVMKNIMTNDSLRESLIRSGYKQVEKFDNSKMIEQYYDLLCKVAKTESNNKYSINGVYQDNWSEKEIEISISHCTEDRYLYVEMILPSISPHKRGQLSLDINGRKRKYSLIADQLIIITEDLPKIASQISIKVESTFSPNEIDIADDRQLGVQILKAEIREKKSNSTLKALHGV